MVCSKWVARSFKHKKWVRVRGGCNIQGTFTYPEWNTFGMGNRNELETEWNSMGGMGMQRLRLLLFTCDKELEWNRLLITKNALLKYPF